VVVSAGGGAPEAVTAIFTSRELFDMFDMPLARGATWSAAADAGAAREVVLDEQLAARLFGSADVVGRELRIHDTPYTVVGTLARRLKHYNSSFLRTRETEDVFLPRAALRPLAAQPCLTFFQGERGATFDELLRSPHGWLFLWVELSGAAARERFIADAAAAGVAARVVPFADALPVLNYVHPAYDLLYLFSKIALVAAALNLLRLLLAKFASRVAETGIHRAMGASRRSVLAQHVIEATLIGLVGGALGLAMGAGVVQVMNDLVPDRPGDAVIDAVAALVTLGVATLIGTLTGGYSAWRATRVPPALFLRSAG
jgi:putative ABC transport system permease protein